MELTIHGAGLFLWSCQVPIKAIVWLLVNFLQVLHVALINCTQLLLKDP